MQLVVVYHANVCMPGMVLTACRIQVTVAKILARSRPDQAWTPLVLMNVHLNNSVNKSDKRFTQDIDRSSSSTYVMLNVDFLHH